VQAQPVGKSAIKSLHLEIKMRHINHMNTAFIQERITKTKALIVIYEDAMAALGTGNTQEYMLDTGQTRQRVTKLNLADMQKTLDGLYNRCATLEARLTGNGVLNARPGW
jgi:hypothetical protein